MYNLYCLYLSVQRTRGVRGVSDGEARGESGTNERPVSIARGSVHIVWRGSDPWRQKGVFEASGYWETAPGKYGGKKVCANRVAFRRKAEKLRRP